MNLRGPLRIRMPAYGRSGCAIQTLPEPAVKEIPLRNTKSWHTATMTGNRLKRPRDPVELGRLVGYPSHDGGHSGSGGGLAYRLF